MGRGKRTDLRKVAIILKRELREYYGLSYREVDDLTSGYDMKRLSDVVSVLRVCDRYRGEGFVRRKELERQERVETMRGVDIDA
jgi:hypothetical protein